MVIEGQNRLSNTFDLFTLETLPHTILLVGEEGCGKHTLCNKLSEKLNIPVEELTDCTFETISEICERTNYSIYILNLDLYNDKKQNAILKFVEEPNSYSFIIMLCSSLNMVLPTIQGRCITYKFEAYDIEYLKTFTDNDKVLKYATTPGQVLNYSEKIEEVLSLVDNVNQNLVKASVGNILVLPTKFRLTQSDSKDLLPLSLFLKVLKSTQTKVSCYSRVAQAIVDTTLNINKQMYLENFFIELRGLKSC